jgi:demethylmenaquinone methyltransferase/2-methoxy-6-polyprenyl-1,4-benzoquinol methylase
MTGTGDSRDSKNTPSGSTTHFGFQQVAEQEKADRVKGVFSSVADRYDVMNDLMSLGLHRIWKRYTLERSLVRAGERVLDIAGGTGDMARLFAQKVGPTGEVYLTDINAAMLRRGRDRLLDDGMMIPSLQVNAEHIPFPDEYFDCVNVSFGLRNMTHKDRALAEMARVTRPGGRVLVLEFSRIWKPLKAPYDVYSFQVLPRLGKAVANDADSYRYLAESIRMHPDQETLKSMMEQAGLEKVEYFNLAAGVVALHRGFRF